MASGGRRTGGGIHRSHHRTTHRTNFTATGRTGLFGRTRTHHHHGTTGMHVSGPVIRTGGRRNNPTSLIVLGSIFLLIGVAELIAVIVMGALMATCTDKCDFTTIIIPVGVTGGIFSLCGLIFIPLGIKQYIQLKKMALMLGNNSTEMGLQNNSALVLNPQPTVIYDETALVGGMNPYPTQNNTVYYQPNIMGQPAQQPYTLQPGYVPNTAYPNNQNNQMYYIPQPYNQPPINTNLEPTSFYPAQQSHQPNVSNFSSGGQQVGATVYYSGMNENVHPTSEEPVFISAPQSINVDNKV